MAMKVARVRTPIFHFIRQNIVSVQISSINTYPRLAGEQYRCQSMLTGRASWPGGVFTRESNVRQITGRLRVFRLCGLLPGLNRAGFFASHPLQHTAPNDKCYYLDELTCMVIFAGFAFCKLIVIVYFCRSLWQGLGMLQI